ncbi:unnamed protein product, partial [Meganyctiphanes norvegica]
PGEFYEAQNSNRLLNADEFAAAIKESPKGDSINKHLMFKRDREATQFIGTDKPMHSVIVCISASGKFFDPMIVYNGPEGTNNQLTHIGSFDRINSSNGWMDPDIFNIWLKHLNTNLDCIQVKRPVLLLLNSYASHVSIASYELAKQSGILLFYLPPHSSHALQPLDVGLFGSLKIR